MYLKEIDLYGFKSFADKTSIVFSPNINGIVGPNGSGKSNILDAVRPGYDGEDKELVILDRQPQPVFQEQHADKVFQQGNGQPCV